MPKQDLGQIILEYNAQHHLSLNKQPAEVQGLQARLRDMLDGRADKSVFIIGDRNVKYGEIMPLIDAGLGAGGRIAIVTDEMRKEASGGSGG